MEKNGKGEKETEVIGMRKVCIKIFELYVLTSANTPTAGQKLGVVNAIINGGQQPIHNVATNLASPTRPYRRTIN